MLNYQRVGIPWRLWDFFGFFLVTVFLVMFGDCVAAVFGKKCPWLLANDGW